MSWPLRHLQLSSARMGDVDMFWAHITTILRNNVKYLIRLLLDSFSSGLVVKHTQLLPVPRTTSEIFKSIERLTSHICSSTVMKSILNALLLAPPLPSWIMHAPKRFHRVSLGISCWFDGGELLKSYVRVWHAHRVFAVMESRRYLRNWRSKNLIGEI